MRHLLTIVTTAVLCGGLVSFGVAADRKAGKPSNLGKAEPRRATPANADLRAETPRTWACAWGGPGMGFRRAWGWGGGGRGPGGGFGPGGGRGWGGGAGGGRGLNPGAGQGRAPGGPAFVDQDNDGVCDYYELRRGMRKQ